MAGSKKRKVDSVTRSLNDEWTNSWTKFILPTVCSKPVCLICSETVAIKRVNVKRHYKTKYKSRANKKGKKGNSSYIHLIILKLITLFMFRVPIFQKLCYDFWMLIVLEMRKYNLLIIRTYIIFIIPENWQYILLKYYSIVLNLFDMIVC